MSDPINTIRSVQELEIRYIRFCAKHDLDQSISAEEQYGESDTQQQWLDRYVESVNLAKRNGILLARGRTDVVRSIARDLNDRLDIVTGINLKKSISNFAQNTRLVIEVVADYSVKPSRKFLICPSPLVLKNSKVMSGGALQLGLPMDL